MVWLRPGCEGGDDAFQHEQCVEGGLLVFGEVLVHSLQKREREREPSGSAQVTFFNLPLSGGIRAPPVPNRAL